MQCLVGELLKFDSPLASMPQKRAYERLVHIAKGIDPGLYIKVRGDIERLKGAMLLVVPRAR